MIEMKLLDNFKELYEKQDILSNQTNHTLYSTYSYSQIHCIEAIEHIPDVNVTKISTYLKITKSAVSKITRHLQAKDCIEAYKKADNKKEVFFRLCDKGKEIYKQHEISHSAWIQRDIEFLNTLQEDEKAATLQVLHKFNAYLQQKIKEESLR